MMMFGGWWKGHSGAFDGGCGRLTVDAEM